MLFISLLIMFAVKHWLGDRELRFAYESVGKHQAKKWLAPLLVHGSIHGGMTFVIVLIFTESPAAALAFGLADMIIHSTIDRLKIVIIRRWPSRWKVLVLADQAFHGLTYLGMIAVLTASGR